MTNPVQKLHDFTGNIALTAGAGAGKTYALVEFYTKLVKGEIGDVAALSCLNILAMTYTEKAAREMRERIRGSLIENGLDDQVEQLERAPISTIHGFCNRILTEFALEAGLDTDYAIIDGREVLNKTVADLVLDGLDQGDEDLRTLIGLFPYGGDSGLVACLADSLSLARSMGELPQQLVRHLDQARMDLPGKVQANQAAYRRCMLELGGVELNDKLKSTPPIRKIIEVANRPLDEAQAELIRANFKGRMPGAVTSIKQKMIDVLDEWERLNAEPDGLIAAEALIRVMGRLDDAYALSKSALSCLDYDDLLLLTRRLLFTNVKVRHKIKARTRIILVDEFQDTNPLQWQIIRCIQEIDSKERLLSEGDDPAKLLTADQCKLVAVGDAKQSIYRFRGAEVEVFTNLTNELTDCTKGGVVRLTTNYRSNPGLVKFFNAFFSQYLGQAQNAYEASFLNKDAQQAHHAGPETGCVEFLDTPPIKTDSQTLRELEAMAVARRIEQLVQDGTPVPVKEREKIGYNDMAILLRSMTHVGVFESALRRLGIPYQLTRSGGLQNEPEIQDMVNLLEFLVQPNNVFLLTSLYRSPMVALSDETITHMALHGGILNYRDVLSVQDITFNDSNEVQRLVKFNRLVADLIARRDRLKPVELIETAMERTDLAAVLLAGFQGKERLANLLGFLEALRTMASSDTPSLADIVTRLRPRNGRKGHEFEPAMFDSGQAVRIMTIHKAKGLEFPIVFLVQSDKTRFGAQTTPIRIRPGLGLGLRLKAPHQRQPVQTWSFHRIKMAEDDREKAESKRLLYVAATRAKDLLIISGLPTAPKSKSISWRKILEDFAANDSQQLCRTVIGNTDSSFEEVTTDHGLDSLDLKTTGETTEQAAEIVSRVINPSTMSKRLEVSVSHLEDYHLCPRLYYRSRVLLESAKIQHQAVSQGLNPTRRGSWFHKIMERLDFGSPGDLRALARQTSTELDYLVTDEDIDEITRLSDLFLRTPLANQLASVAIKRELSFNLGIELENGFMRLNGEIDVLKINDDKMAIYDYKLTKPGSGNYAFQLMTYGLAVAKSVTDHGQDILANLPELNLIYVFDGGVKIQNIPFNRQAGEWIQDRLVRLGDKLIRTGDSFKADDWPCQPYPSLAKECLFHKGECSCG